jgi:hypothetical protein
MDSSVKQPGVDKDVKRLWITKLSLRCIAIIFSLILVGLCVAGDYPNIMLIGPVSHPPILNLITTSNHLYLGRRGPPMEYRRGNNAVRPSSRIQGHPSRRLRWGGSGSLACGGRDVGVYGACVAHGYGVLL